MTALQDIPSDDGSTNERLMEEATVPWPACTKLVRDRGSKSLNLTSQQHQVKLVVSQAMKYVEEKVIFDNAFPNMQMRNAWSTDGVVRACDKIGNFSPCSVQRIYDCIASRVQGDAYYMKALSSLVRIPPFTCCEIFIGYLFRSMRASVSFEAKPKQLRLTMSRDITYTSIPASTSGRSMTFCMGSSIYIQSRSVQWLYSSVINDIFRVQVLIL